MVVSTKINFSKFQLEFFNQENSRVLLLIRSNLNKVFFPLSSWVACGVCSVIGYISTDVSWSRSTVVEHSSAPKIIGPPAGHSSGLQKFPSTNIKRNRSNAKELQFVQMPSFDPAKERKQNQTIKCSNCHSNREPQCRPGKKKLYGSNTTHNVEIKQFEYRTIDESGWTETVDQCTLHHYKNTRGHSLTYWPVWPYEDFICCLSWFTVDW